MRTVQVPVRGFGPLAATGRSGREHGRCGWVISIQIVAHRHSGLALWQTPRARTLLSLQAVRLGPLCIMAVSKDLKS